MNTVHVILLGFVRAYMYVCAWAHARIHCSKSLKRPQNTMLFINGGSLYSLVELQFLEPCSRLILYGQHNVVNYGDVVAIFRRK